MSAATALSGDAQQFLTFAVGREEYGVDIMAVREIKAWSGVTRLPNTSKHLRGVMNLRGTIIPIFDLRARFSGDATEPHPKHVVIIVAVEDRTIGILVDAVSDIVDAAPDMIKPPPTADLAIDERYVRGLISLDSRMIVILDIPLLFDTDPIEISAAAAPSAASSHPAHQGA